MRSTVGATKVLRLAQLRVTFLDDNKGANCPDQKTARIGGRR
jgi:hypothetical protein